ncbi:MAG: nucleotidyl transferase AbiEii/AbiGii toxin family protein [Pseudomonadota bacterium]
MDLRRRDGPDAPVPPSPNLTDEPFEVWEILGQPVKVETAAEIVAKKLYHRGDRATARDLFDLAVVVEQESIALAHAAPFLLRHAAAFLGQIEAGPPIMREQFARIQRISFDRSFDECVALARDFLNSLREADDSPQRARERQRL